MAKEVEHCHREMVVIVIEVAIRGKLWSELDHGASDERVPVDFVEYYLVEHFHERHSGAL